MTKAIFTFKQIRRIDLPLVMTWRMRPEVTRYMNTDPLLTLEDQERWHTETIERAPIPAYWIIRHAETPIGVINLANTDIENKRTSYGFYIGEIAKWQLGGLIPPYFYNELFRSGKYNFDKVIAEVFAENVNVIKLHNFHGFRTVGVMTKHIYKRNKAFDVVLMELLKEEWLEKKEFSKYITDFED